MGSNFQNRGKLKLDFYIVYNIWLIIINLSTTKKAEDMSKLISELLYRVNSSMLRDSIKYKNDLLPEEDILAELDKEKK